MRPTQPSSPMYGQQRRLCGLLNPRATAFAATGEPSGAPRRLDLLERAMPRFRHADIHPEEPEDAEGREQPEGVGLADRIDDREEEFADQERRAPVDRGRHRNRPAAHLAGINLVDDRPGHRAEGECERDDEYDKRNQRDDARRPSSVLHRAARLLKREPNGGEAQPHADEARDQEAGGGRGDR